jgi:hypothetical protein
VVDPRTREETIMHTRSPMPVLLGTAVLVLTTLPVAGASAAEQTVIENPAIAAPGVCSATGLIGQTITPQVGGELSEYGFSTAALDGEPGDAASATVTISEWIDGGVLPIVEDDVELPAGADQALTMFTPPQPVLLTAGSTYAIEFDFDGFDDCPVAFGPGAAYDGGDLLLDGEPTAGQDLAFRLVFGGLGGVPGAPTLTGTPPAGTVGESYSFQFTVTGTPTPSMSVLSGPLPPGLTLSESGHLAGTPTQAGTFPVMFNAENGQVPSATVFHMFMIGAGLGAPDPSTAPPSTAPAPGAAPPSTPIGRSTRSVGLAESGSDVLPSVLLGGAALLAGLGALTVAGLRRRRQY